MLAERYSDIGHTRLNGRNGVQALS